MTVKMIFKMYQYVLIVRCQMRARVAKYLVRSYFGNWLLFQKIRLTLLTPHASK